MRIKNSTSPRRVGPRQTARLAGSGRAPGRGLINTAMVLPALLDGGLFAVSLSAQYQYIFRAKNQSWPAIIEATALDAGMVIFSLLALGLARGGQSARIERALILVCSFGSAGMNYAAADITSPRSVLAYTMPPVFLAVVTDRVIAVVRRHVLGMEERSAWAGFGRAVALAAKLTLFSSHRVRRMRWRIMFRLRPGEGFATLAELTLRWSRLAAVRHGRRARPSMHLHHRVMARTTAHAIRLGRAQYGRRVFARAEDQTIILSLPRSGKSGMLGDRVIDHPGAALVTESRPDIYTATAAYRTRLGPIEVFNPENVSGIPSTFTWGMTIGCEDPAEAIRRATDLVGAIANTGDMAWWIEKSAGALAGHPRHPRHGHRPLRGTVRRRRVHRRPRHHLHARPRRRQRPAMGQSAYRWP